MRLAPVPWPLRLRRGLAEHPDLWPLVVELGLDEFAAEVEDEDARSLEQDVEQDVGQAVAQEGERAVAATLRVRGTSRRRAGATPLGFKPSRARRTFAGSVVNRPGVAAWSGRAAID